MWRQRSPKGKDYDAQQAREKFERGEVKLLDVREPYEWDDAHVAGATWIPLGQLQRRYSELDPNAEWVCVCHLGSRSAAAADFLRQVGYNAVNMIGGMDAWEGQGFPTESGGGS